MRWNMSRRRPLQEAEWAPPQTVEKGLTEFGSKSQIEFNSFLARACTGPKILIVRQVYGFLEQKSVRAVGLQTRANACICAKGCQKYFFDSLGAAHFAIRETAGAIGERMTPAGERSVILASPTQKE